MTDDAQLLARFGSKRDEDAFSELVSRHFDLVFSTALRQLNGDTHLAKDVAQTVFTDLARKARLLSRKVVLAGWLYEATRFASAKAVRTEQRRRAREQEALHMQELNERTPVEWEQLRSVLDAAMGKLNFADRNAVLLHYFERKDFRTVGLALGISNDAAQKRVSRALTKLRVFLAQSGVAPSFSVLAAMLSTATVEAAPVGMAASVAKGSLAGAAALGPVGAAKFLMEVLGSIKAKLVGGGALALVLGIVAVHWGYGPNLFGQRPFSTLDLSSHYNGGLRTNWTPAYGVDNNLAALGEGRRVFDGVPFDIGGVLQLQGQVFKSRGYRFPESAERIRVRDTARRIFLLHANSGFMDAAGTTVAKLVLHYADGEQAELPVIQQVHFLDWWEWRQTAVKSTDGADTVVAWRGRNAAAEAQGATLRLFKTAFVNPYPEKRIQTLDYVSAMTNGAPFLVAITLEHRARELKGEDLQTSQR